MRDPTTNAKALEATQTYAFRNATLEDIPALKTVIEQSLRGLSTNDYSQDELDGSIGFLFGPDTLLIHDSTYFILHPSSSPSTICACGGWSFRQTLFGADSAPGRLPATRPLTSRASIRAIFTHPDFARQGLGTMVMRYCEEKAQGAGYRGLEMGSTLTGVGLYERCGYVKSGREDTVVRCPNGAGIRVVHMAGYWRIIQVPKVAGPSGGNEMQRVRNVLPKHLPQYLHGLFLCLIVCLAVNLARHFAHGSDEENATSGEKVGVIETLKDRIVSSSRRGVEKELD
ncbi:hypothetical protein P154DRAFT_566208 [Amniculicola lignicola CBS 123094]|uniref:N-acetyltransferase domain-containing protein n=1 Tax=Amniculicola lignicola CBS 123094 TaxID=1392246 RepID=A0A6A5W7V7_9PLEO|nr:hypothetical protein P154DRAFT_566208 [Amniculicola lignicola CBS 123094]